MLAGCRTVQLGCDLEENRRNALCHPSLSLLFDVVVYEQAIYHCIRAYTVRQVRSKR
jgi:hypothetical protein